MYNNGIDKAVHAGTLKNVIKNNNKKLKPFKKQLKLTLAKFD